MFFVHHHLFFLQMKKFSQNSWKQNISKLSVSALWKHFVKLWTGADICGFIKLMAVTGLAVVESISNSLSSWSLNLLILLDYPLPSSSSMCTEIQDMNASLGIEGSWRLTYEGMNDSDSFGKDEIVHVFLSFPLYICGSVHQCIPVFKCKHTLK